MTEGSSQKPSSVDEVVSLNREGLVSKSVSNDLRDRRIL